MIQAGENCSVEMLHTLCNQIYYSKDCPKDWGKAIIVPLHKKGDRAVCSNYRAISLLSVPGKVYTKVLQQRLKRYLEESMSEEQAGFRKGMEIIYCAKSITKTIFMEERILPMELNIYP